MRITALALVLLASPLLRSQDVTPENVDAWVERIAPTDDELAWREIPWHARLWDAVQEAQCDERPLLIWAMNGHPLGCT